MRPNRLARTLVSATTVIGIAVGGTLATAGGAFAAPEPTTKPAATAEATSLAVVNLGLAQYEAEWVQCWLYQEGYYYGAIDGLLGSNSWSAFQSYLKNHNLYYGQVDGIVGPKTIKALQRFLANQGYYGGYIDGIAGPKTREGFSDFALYECPVC